ncbi:atos homolog protein A isoform X2 [Ambystoma mexicanum]|uniref:atos homolog protein A isoform X2 n=1 Tax=Ambystoma mexicanum TaxID=8296 RepID=UPI0037E7C899
MKPDRDTSDEFFEYDAEEFLVSLALLITEGRTPEYSAKGRTEGFHCPPAKSSEPVSTKHECSDKVAQCCQARRTRSEVVVLWKNNIPIMVEVMLLPDCCYSDDGSTAEGSDLKDPAIKQDAMLLERWLLEPVPRQSGDRFIEEKTLLLAVRSFVFFSQLSAWLSVSHGAVPRNILYRVSAADGELQWSFSQPPTEHMFPVPNVSHNVALKVSVQSLPRQSNYPVLNCSIHTNLTFYEKRIQEHERSTRQHFDSLALEPQIVPGTQHSFGKQAWTVTPEHVLHARTCLSPDLSIALRHCQLCTTTSCGYDTESSQSKARCCKSIGDSKPQLHETPSRTFKSFSLVSPLAPNPLCPPPAIVEANPLIGSLLQERQDVIARIAQHLIHCDPPTSHINGRLFNGHDSSSSRSKRFWNSGDENMLKNVTEASSTFNYSLYSSVAEEDAESKIGAKPHTPCSSTRPSGDHKTSPKPQARRKLFLTQSIEPVSCTFLQSLNKITNPPTCTTLSPCKEKASVNVETLIADSPLKDKVTNINISKHCSSCKATDYICTNTYNPKAILDKDCFTDVSSPLHVEHSEKQGSDKVTVASVHIKKLRCLNEDSSKTNVNEQKIQLINIEHLKKANNSFTCTDKPDKLKTAHNENEDPRNIECRISHDRNCIANSLTNCEQRKSENLTKTIPLKHSSVWKKHEFRSFDGSSTNAFHPGTGLPLLSSPVPQRKTKSGYFDLDTSFLQLKSLSTRSTQQYLNTEDFPDSFDSYLLSASAPPATSLSLLGNFEESVLNYRLEPLGIVDGFTADVGASGLFCPTHMTLPVEVSFYSVSDDNAPSPYMGVITLESLGKRGYRVPPSGTIQVTLFNPNNTVVKMFVVIYDLREMPANQQTFLRQRTFSIPVKKEVSGNVKEESLLNTEERTLRYLIHLRFQSSKSGKIYLHRDVRLLFSRKSMEVDSGAVYKLKSYTESPTNPQFSPRC